MSQPEKHEAAAPIREPPIKPDRCNSNLLIVATILAAAMATASTLFAATGGADPMAIVTSAFVWAATAVCAALALRTRRHESRTAMYRTLIRDARERRQEDPASESVQGP